jgi:hypothetical protein
MSKLTLQRYCYSESETEGWLWIDDDTRLHTIERPWKRGAPGGLPFVSCVPDGTYRLDAYVRSNGDVVPRLRNPDLHVYHTAEERAGAKGRYSVLIHIGNYVDDVVGCIAPGLDRIISKGRPMVTNSRKAMEMIMLSNPTEIEIVCACGTGP